MNTTQLIAKNLLLPCILAFFSFTSSFANSPSSEEILKRVENLNTVIDVKVTDDVAKEVLLLVEKRRKQSSILLGRTSLYFPMIENAIREKNLPDELKYVAVIESSLIPTIHSHMGAAGIWQFMKGTGSLYGLRIDKHVDERRDPVLATYKALDHLKELYDIYGNWTLAIAAYNCGSGNVNRAIKKAGGSTDFWQIRKFLPKETQRYIPRFIAASYLMTYYYLHDLEPIEPSDDMKYISAVKVFKTVDFKKVSNEFDIDLDIIRMLNPMFRKDVIPGTAEGKFLFNLPDQKMFSFIDRYSSWDHIVTHPLSAERKPVASVVNNDIPTSSVKTNLNTLLQDVRSSEAVRDNLQRKTMQSLQKNIDTAAASPRMHKLKRKESLMDVALAYNIPLEDLIAYNNINVEAGLNPGSVIKLSK
jgi:membrane-bound lytic murein transglycosylase D